MSIKCTNKSYSQYCLRNIEQPCYGNNYIEFNNEIISRRGHYIQWKHRYKKYLEVLFKRLELVLPKTVSFEIFNRFIYNKSSQKISYYL